jgi:polyhydroxyalkanoate synthesis regulator phasin
MEGMTMSKTVTKYDNTIDQLEEKLVRYKRNIDILLDEESGNQKGIDAFANHVDALRVALAALYQAQAQEAK